MERSGGRGGKTAPVAPLAQGYSRVELPAEMGGQTKIEEPAWISNQPSPCTRSLNILPAVKAGTRLASILIFSPVLGFRP